MQFAQRGVWGSWKPHKYWVFPHYTWGYIDFLRDEERRGLVPSLYVRVYRFHKPTLTGVFGSLTIREGISSYCSICSYFIWLFPHYTWGYIPYGCRAPVRSPVPSLYVRVYRRFLRWLHQIESSLTIREGISEIRVKPGKQLLFPHYTWGYIAQRPPIRFR